MSVSRSPIPTTSVLFGQREIGKVTSLLNCRVKLDVADDTSARSGLQKKKEYQTPPLDLDPTALKPSKMMSSKSHS
jgi:hypothetical protein